MSLNGYQLAADLSALRAIGAVDLPGLAYDYATLNNAIANTTTMDSAAFQNPGGGGMGQIFAAWSDLRTELQNVFGLTANNMQSAAAAILHIADAYAASDASAADALNRAWNNGPPSNALDTQEKPPPGQIPPVVLNQ